MKRKTGFILYIDILGYKDMLNSKENDKRLQNILDRFTDIFSKLNFAFAFGQNYDECKLLKKFFSDNFLFLYEASKDNFMDFSCFKCVASQIQYQFLLAGILTRGSITYGTIYYNDDIVYGVDLIKAVELEKNHKEPSVKINSSFRALSENNHEEFTDTVDLFCVHPNSKLDYDDCVNGISKYIENLDYRYVDERVLYKINWIIERLNDYFGKDQNIKYVLTCDYKYSLVAVKEGK